MRRVFLKSMMIAFVGVGALTACSSIMPKSPGERILDSHRKAANALIASAGGELPLGTRMIAASFADINNLHSSSAFGRITTQQLVSAFVDRGYPFVEMLMRDSVYIDKNEGEFLLSREVGHIAETHSAPVVLVGTYAVGRENVFVTAKLVRTSDSTIVASYDYTVPFGHDVRTMVYGARPH